MHGYHRRLKFVELIEQQGMPISRACREVGISRTWGYQLLNRYYDEGPAGLETRSSAPGSTPTRVSDTVKRKVIVMALKHPRRGAKWLAKNLSKQGAKISEGKVYAILRDNDIAKQNDRIRILLRRYEQDKSLSPTTLDEMGTIEPMFTYRRLTRSRLGELVFCWDEYGRVRHTRRRTRLFILLDGCGSVMTVIPSLVNFTKERRQASFARAVQLGSHAYTDPVYYMHNKLYKFCGIPLKGLVFPSSIQGLSIIKAQVSDKLGTPIKLYKLPQSEFWNLPIIANFRGYFKQELLKKRLKQIIHDRRDRITAQKINECVNKFVMDYNSGHQIAEWPNCGLAPYAYAQKQHKIDIKHWQPSMGSIKNQ